MALTGDPKELIVYLETFYSAVKGGMGWQAYDEGARTIRADLSAIVDPAIRERALELQRHVESGGYILQRHPAMRETVVLPTIRKLIDYLVAVAKPR